MQQPYAWNRLEGPNVGPGIPLRRVSCAGGRMRRYLGVIREIAS